MTDKLPFEDDELDLDSPEFSLTTEEEDELLEMALKHLGTFLTEHEHHDPDWAKPEDPDRELSEPEGSPSY
jgi:hypothetical protein